MKIGLKIKTLRKQQQMTLEQLAQKSRLSTGVLSQLERDLSTPRVATLQKISKTFGVTMSSLFSDDHLPNDGHKDREKESQNSGFFAVVRKQQRKKVFMPWGATMEMLCPDLRHKVEFWTMLNRKVSWTGLLRKKSKVRSTCSASRAWAK